MSTRVAPSTGGRVGGLALLSAVLAVGLVGCETTIATVPAPQDAPQEVPSTMVHPDARHAISEIRSPYCPGLMLEVCPSPDAKVLRDSIETLARGGLSADSIVERVIAEYGEEWRAVPRRQGAGWWAWIMPAAALLLGAGLVALVLARRRRSEPAASGPRSVSADEQARLDRAMEELDESELPEW